jgi:hypothetical protein
MENNTEAKTPKYRDVVMNISPDEDAKLAKVSYRITVRFVFTDLTEQQIIDLLFDSSSLRVKVPKITTGRKGAKTSRIPVKTGICGMEGDAERTRATVTTRIMTPEEMVHIWRKTLVHYRPTLHSCRQ